MPTDKTGHFYYSWYPTIFQRDTQHLSPAEDGAYRRLIDHYMLTRSPLPNDDRALSRIVGVGLDEWNLLKTQLVSYFKTEGLSLRHSFCDAALQDDLNRIQTSRKNGKKGGRPSSSHSNKTSEKIPDNKPSGNPAGSPITKLNNTKHLDSEAKASSSKAPPEWVPIGPWNGWLAMRRKIPRSPFTPKAYDLAIAALDTLRIEGHDLAAIIDRATLNSWKSFYPTKGHDNATSRQPTSAFPAKPTWTSESDRLAAKYRAQAAAEDAANGDGGQGEAFGDLGACLRAPA